MNGLKCPNCGLVNLLESKNCHRCNTDLRSLGPDAEVSVPVDQTFSAQKTNMQNAQVPMDNELGRKTHFWYRVYCAAMTALYLLVLVVGIALAIASFADPNSIDAEANAIMGIAYAVVGFVLMVVFALGLFLPRKSFHWIYGIILIAFGMTSCCILPASIPLLIFWLKPETKAYFGRT